jgi:hypothetical protein
MRYAINYILAKVNPIDGLPPVLKIFKTKIIVNNKNNSTNYKI